MVNKKVLVWLIWNTKGDSSPTGHLTADICKGFATSRPDELNFNGMVGTSDISKRCTIYPQSKPKKIVNQGGALLF